MYAVGFQPSMEANYSEIAKMRKSKGLPAAVPQIYDPEDHSARPTARASGMQDKTPTSTPNPAAQHSGHPEHASAQTAVATGARYAQENAAPAPLDKATDEAELKRGRLSSSGAGARASGVMLTFSH
jgi:hypothetical protein